MYIKQTVDPGKEMGFGILIIWREPKNHIDDCYFRLQQKIDSSFTIKINLYTTNLIHNL